MRPLLSEVILGGENMEIYCESCKKQLGHLQNSQFEPSSDFINLEYTGKTYGRKTSIELECKCGHMTEQIV